MKVLLVAVAALVFAGCAVVPAPVPVPVPGVSIGVDLAVPPTTFRVARLAERRWVFVVAATGDALAVDLDADGIPILPEGDTWPLELDHGH